MGRLSRRWCRSLLVGLVASSLLRYKVLAAACLAGALAAVS